MTISHVRIKLNRDPHHPECLASASFVLGGCFVVHNVRQIRDADSKAIRAACDCAVAAFMQVQSERDAALARVRELEAEVADAQEEIFRQVGGSQELLQEIARLKAEVSVRDTKIAELEGRVAKLSQPSSWLDRVQRDEY